MGYNFLQIDDHIHVVRDNNVMIYKFEGIYLSVQKIYVVSIQQ